MSGIRLFIIFNKIISRSPIVTILEVIWTVLPIIILIFLAIPSLQILYYIEETDPFLTLKVIGNQWYWNYELADFNLDFDSYIISQATEGDFRLLDVDHRVVLPVSKEIRTLISAADVLHCWTLPRVGVKADAVPGRLNQVFFNILRPRVIYGQCSEICGANHRFIPITVECLSTHYFIDWLNN